MTSALDEAVIAQLLDSVGGDPEFLAEIVDDFLADAPVQIDALRQAAGSGDAVGARRAAHTLKGNARTFGAAELASVCAKAETAAEAAELDRVLADVDGIEREWARVRDAILVFRNDSA